ncbi:MAG: DNA alkylation repair protein [Chitinophagaceae bacterium]
MNHHLKEIQSILSKNSSATAKSSTEKFVPGVEKIYGIRMPFLNELAGKFKEGGFELVEELWNAGAFEEKILAAKLLGKIARQNPEHSIRLVSLFSKNIGNWAVCDAIGMQSLKPIVKTHREKIFALAKKLNGSKDLWQRRLSLALVEWYTRIPELHSEIEKLIANLEKDDEYYVQKAIVWIRRNFKKGK